MQRFKKSQLALASLISLALIATYLRSSSPQKNEEEQLIPVKRQSFEVTVNTVGELEAAHSLTISSTGKGDCKIIYLIPDGKNVEKDEVLIKIDPTPFEDKLETLRSKLKEQIAHSESLQKGLAWEISQAERDEKMAAFEIEATELELNKVVKGDGPLEISRLKGTMQKAYVRYTEMEGYCKDLAELEEQGFLNPIEVRNAQKKLEEEKEAYETTKLQYESYVENVHPMHVKKAEASAKQARIRQEEANKIRGHSIGKAIVEYNQSLQAVENIKWQCGDAERELALTNILAPTPGMVVHREEFRNSQRRKPRIGDLAVRNQPLLDLPDLSLMTVKSKVREVDLCKVEMGTRASVEVDAYPSLLLTGAINSIGVLALPDPMKPSDEKYFEIRVLLDKSDPKIRPGMTTRLIIYSAEVADALTVPVHAVFHEQKKAYCYVATKYGYEKREVIPGAHNDEVAEVKEGLSEGENVCLSVPKSLL